MLVHVESQSLLLRAKDPQKIKNIIPRWRDVDYDGHNIAVPHRLDEVRVLRNIGVPAPAPILYYYNWPSPPDKQALDHQRNTAAFMTLYNRAFCFNEPGTMKTSSMLWAADHLMKLGSIRRVLVVAPNSSLDLTWMSEIFAFLMHRRAVVLVGTKKRRIELLSTDSHFYVINHEGLAVVADDLRGRSDIDLVIGDECDVYTNGSTDLYETFEEVTRKRKLWLLSGTPCPKEPTQAWALTRLVNKARVPMYYSQWRRQTMMQMSTYKWVPRSNSYELAYQAMQPAIRYLKKDCVDMPPTVVVRRQAELTKEQKKAITQMKNEAVMDAANGVQISAVNAADKINKLRQIMCGVVKNPETGEYEEFPHQPRVDLLLTEMSHAVSKVLIIVPFKGIIKSLHRDISKHYTVEVINGDVTRNQRSEIVNRFKTQADPHALLCHPRVMSHSLNLAEASTTIFFAPIYSNGQAQQVIERMARPGQQHHMTLVRIGAHPLEWEIYKILDTRAVGQESILKLYRQELLGEPS